MKFSPFRLSDEFLQAAQAAASPGFMAPALHGVRPLPLPDGGPADGGTGGAGQGGSDDGAEGDGSGGGDGQEGEEGEEGEGGDDEVDPETPDAVRRLIREERAASKRAARAAAAALKRAEAAEKRAKEYEDRDKSELEKATERAEESDKRAESAESLVARLTLENAFYRVPGIEWNDPEVAFDLAMRSGLSELDASDGKVDNAAVKKVVKELAKTKSYLVKAEEDDSKKRASGGSFNGGKGGAEKTNDPNKLAGKYAALRGRSRS